MLKDTADIRVGAGNTIYVLFYVHFSLYLLALFNLPVELRQLIRISITFLYVIVTFVAYFYQRRTETPLFFLALGAVGVVLAVKLVLVGSLPHFIPYAVFMMLVFRNFDIDETRFIQLINICFLFFFLVSFLVHFGLLPLSFIKYHDVGMRIMYHRLIPAINRFRSIEAMSPAGIDSLAGMVLLLNVLRVEPTERIRRLPFICLALLILVWAGSLTPVVALAMAVIVSRAFYWARFVFIALISVIPFILIQIYRTFSLIYRVALEMITSDRMQIWDKMMTEFHAMNMLKKLFGPGDSIEVFALGIYIKNPHNFTIDMLFNYGIILFCMVTLYLVVSVGKIRSRSGVALVVFLIAAAMTNNYIFSIYNPLYMFVFMFYTGQGREVHGVATRTVG